MNRDASSAAPVQSPHASVLHKLQAWQGKLLDLSRANRLLYYKATKSSSTAIAYPAPAGLFQQLVVRGKVLTFPITDDKTLFDLESSDNAEETKSAIARQYKAGEIGSPLSDQQLSRVLYNLRARSRSALEEQGVNVLFLALGLLRWFESVDGEAVVSPLLLVPVTLDREALRKPYTLAMFEDDLVLNPTLAHKLDADFALQLPEPQDDLEGNGLLPYLDQIKAAIRPQKGWTVQHEAHLGIFSFQKLSLYADLKSHEDLFRAHPFIIALSGGAPLPRPVGLIEAEELDECVSPETVYQVVDADSSQQEAILAAKQGASFVLQGPPGTGKSQTIANIIAEFLAGRKTVLFVSEKMAALEVVQRRLNETGIGQFCLQLHSHKRDKREVVTELVQALDAPPVRQTADCATSLAQLAALRRTLNAYVGALHKPRFALQLSCFRVHGEMARLLGVPELPFSVGDTTRVGGDEFTKRLSRLEQFGKLSEVVDNYDHHPWQGSTMRDVGFELQSQVVRALGDLVSLLPAYQQNLKSLAAASGLRAPANLAESEGLFKTLLIYDPAIFRLDLALLRTKFAKRYKLFVRDLLPGYRTDLASLRQVRRAPTRLGYQEACLDLEIAATTKLRLAGESSTANTAPDVQPLAHETAEQASQVQHALMVVAQLFGGTPPTVCGRQFSEAAFQDIQGWISQCYGHSDELKDWASLLRLQDEANAHELGSFVSTALSKKLPAADWQRAYLYAFYRNFVDAATASDSALKNFDSRNHMQGIASFRQLDREHLSIAQALIQARLSERRPKRSWLDAASAEQTILRREAAKKRRLKPLRRLFSEIPRLITDLKPCLLMSPVTVAMLLDPNLHKFDLVIFDEASQITPEDAVGAILRGSQTIIVGDKQQLPPTRFFTALGEDVDDDDLYEDYVFDSILEESEGINLPQKMLLWHYRSRHESLIAFSNYYFYDNRLYTFPSVQQPGPGVGLEFIHVPNGVYRRGKTLRRNEIEARRVVDLIFEHFQKSPDKTLGVIAFSQAQQEAIRMEWERRRREQPSFERFFDEAGRESLFIKNLETVQGDERDVIIFSIGYGRDETGKLTLNFGPLNRAGGERRLNVAVSRARYQVKLVSSIMPEEIDLARTNSLGARRLRQYMEVTRDGLKKLYADVSVDDRLHFDSPFEQAVYDAITRKGLTVHTQVGVSGYRIDLAVVDPKMPGRYLLGIECDGATYHSARTARDRDRLRQQILEGLGWRIHRIWSRDWLNNRAREMDKLDQALQEARNNQSRPDADPSAAKPKDTPPASAFLAAVPAVRQVPVLPKEVRTYTPADLRRHATDSRGILRASIMTLAEEFVEVVMAEGPVHVELALSRVAEAWGIGRLGSRVRSALDLACGQAIRSGRVIQKGEFLWPRAILGPLVRVPPDGEKPRPIEYVAPEEIAEAAYLCVAEGRSLSMNDLIRETARLLGYDRIGDKIGAAIERSIEALRAAKRIEIDDDKIRLV